MCALCMMLNYDIHTDNTTYSWKPGSGNTYVNGTVETRHAGSLILDKVIDGGGVDTFDLRAYKTNLSITLEPDQSSSFDKPHRAAADDGASHGNVFNTAADPTDTRYLIENALGGSGNDRIEGNITDNALFGGAGADRIFGMAGDDHLAGGKGADQLFGGEGNDRLWGNAGNDQFHFTKGEAGGADVIMDFTAGEKIALDGFDRGDLNAIMAGATQERNAVVLHIDDASTVTIDGLTLHELSRGDFVLG